MTLPMPRIADHSPIYVVALYPHTRRLDVDGHFSRSALRYIHWYAHISTIAVYILVHWLYIISMAALCIISSSSCARGLRVYVHTTHATTLRFTRTHIHRVPCFAALGRHRRQRPPPRIAPLDTDHTHTTLPSPWPPLHAFVPTTHLLLYMVMVGSFTHISEQPNPSRRCCLVVVGPVGCNGAMRRPPLRGRFIAGCVPLSAAPLHARDAQRCFKKTDISVNTALLSGSPGSTLHCAHQDAL